MKGSYTQKGLILAAKVAAGTALTVTRVTAGSGTTAAGAATLSEHRQTLAAGTPSVTGKTAVLPVTLAEAQADVSYSLTEIGVFANDPDAGEILYQVFRLSAPIPVTAKGASVFRFYLSQSFGSSSTGNIYVSCSPTGLLLDKDLDPIRSKVLAERTRQRSAVVEAEEAVRYINALPRLLTDELTVQLTGAATVSERLELVGFYGPGSLTVNGFLSMDSVFTGGCRIDRCSALILLSHLNFTGGSKNNHWWQNAVVSVLNSPCVRMEDSTVDAANVDGSTGLCAYNNGRIVVSRSQIKNAKDQAVYCFQGGTATLTQCGGSGNAFGFCVDDGGSIFHGTGTPDTMGAASNYRSGGGLIVSHAGPK